MNEDITILCECGTPFTFTVGEQKFYEQKGFQQPKRCPSCRAKKRRERGTTTDTRFPNGDDQGRWRNR